MITAPRRTVHVVALCAALMAACTPETGSAASTLAPATSTSTTTSTTLAGADSREADAVRTGTADLIPVVEDLRGLPFIGDVAVLVLEPDPFRVAWDAATAAAFDREALNRAGHLYRLMALLEPATSLSIMLDGVPANPPVAFYDPTEQRVVISTAAADLTPTHRSHIVHALVHLLIDEHFDAEQLRREAGAAGAIDRERALDGLIEGDATYFELLYVQQLSPEDQAEVATAFAASGSPAADRLPGFVKTDLAFAYEEGVAFVRDLLVTGGIAALDQTYADPPEATEHILHPERYRRGELPREVAPVDVEIPGAATTVSSAYGEQGLRRLLGAVLDPGMVTQAADGWAGDAHQFVTSAGSMAFGYTLRMESDDDAIEVARALVDHASGVLELGDGVAVGGGFEWEGRGRYVYIDRIGDGIAYVVADSADLGRRVRDQLTVP